MDVVIILVNNISCPQIVNSVVIAITLFLVKFAVHTPELLSKS